MTVRFTIPERGGRGLFGRLHHLKMLHRRLQAQIDAEAARPMPDALLIQELKRRRLRTKDEVALVSNLLTRMPTHHVARSA